MNNQILEDIEDVKRKMSLYVDKGRTISQAEVKEEPVITVKLDKSRLKPLKKIVNCDAQFLAVDCSTRTLKRASNWGIYLMRATFTIVADHRVDWGYNERIYSVIGDSFTRGSVLQDTRLELESEMALKQIHRVDSGDFLLLDGPSYFGGPRKFRMWLYEAAEKKTLNLLCISKQSRILHDERGRDFIAAVYMISPHTIWLYYPAQEANKDKNLYGDVSVVKLCEDSHHVFRCDVMEYLKGDRVDDLISSLTYLSNDPRCLGYPVPLWLAHDFSAPSDTMLVSYYDKVEEALRDVGLLETLRCEELVFSFADELHGVKHAFEWEWWGEQV